MIFDCHFRHAIVINRLSIQINRHLSTPINCPTSSGHSIISSIDCTTSSDHSIFPSIDCPTSSDHSIFPSIDCTTSSDHSIISSIDCSGFTPWAGVCRVFDAGREMSMRVSLGSLPLFSNFPQSLPTDSRNPFSTSQDHNNMWQTFY